MQTINNEFLISYEGWDLTAKNIYKLDKGTALDFKRVDDDLDTFEIVISYNNIDIDMLAYEDSLTIVPYLDLDLLEITSVTVKDISLVHGKTNAQNILNLTLSVDISYDENYLQSYTWNKGEVLLSRANRPLSMEIISLNDYEESIINQPFLNQYTFSIDIDEDTKFLFPETNFEDDESYFFGCEILLNEDFSKCKIFSYVQNEDEEKTLLTLSEFEKETFLELVNHYRIFKEEETIYPLIEN